MTAPCFNTASMLLYEARMSIGGHRLRTFLAMLGIIIGVSSVVLMVAIGEGSKRKVEEALAALGPETLVVYPGNWYTKGLRWATSRSLQYQDAEAISQLPMVVAAAAITEARTITVTAGTNYPTTQLFGTTHEFFTIRDSEFITGGPFTPADIRQGERVAIIGSLLAWKLFPGEMKQKSDVVGRAIRIGDAPFRVAGVLASKGIDDFAGRNQDDTIYIPITTAKTRFWTDDSKALVRHILVKTVSKEMLDKTAAEITSLLRQRQKLSDTMANGFTIGNMTSLVKAASDTANALSLLLASLASISLVVGAIGIMNIMLVTVAERTREIGIRKAVGASEWHILLQFLLEAVIISFLGSLVGLVLGVGSGMVAKTWFEWNVVYSLWSVILAIVVAIIVGIISGLYPAFKASRLEPIQALRAQVT